jgi:tRNA pseudouridine38-40 synthase
VALQRVRLDIEYDGTDYAGWQVQPRQATVQGVLEHALGLVLRRQVRLVGAGRTDAGVHATGQVAHADLPFPLDYRRIKAGINALTPASVVVTAIREASARFDARRSATGRAYVYRLATRPVAYGRQYLWSVHSAPSLAAMQRCARTLPGVHDFVSFCVARSAPKGTRCRVLEAKWGRAGAELRFRIVADRFVHGMVRSLVGSMVEVGLGRMTPEAFESLLKSGRRRGTGPAAPAEGLCLTRVFYPDDRPA